MREYLEEAAIRLIKEGESALHVLDEIPTFEGNSCAPTAYSWRERWIGEKLLCNRLLLKEPWIRYDNLIEAVGYHPQTPNAASLVRKMLERYPELREGRFMCLREAWDAAPGTPFVRFPCGFSTNAPLDVLRVMAEFGWHMNGYGAVVALHSIAHERDYPRMRVMLSHDVLKRVDRRWLLDYCLAPPISATLHEPLRWLLRYDEQSVRTLIAIKNVRVNLADESTYLVPLLNRAIGDYVEREQRMRAAILLLCAGGGAWTFAFYKIQQFLY